MEPEIHKEPVRYYEIDLLRFLAALSVVFYHYTYRAYMQGNLSPVAYPTLSVVTKYGWLGVHLFFIISGYVVLLSANGKTIRQFFLSRVTRLYPAFWAAATLTWCFVRLCGPHPNSIFWNNDFALSIKDYLVNMTMLYGFLGSKQIDSAYWSLTVEISFYVLIALVIGWNLYRGLPVLLLVWLGYTVVYLLGKSLPFSEYVFPGYAPYFVAGMAFYMLQNKWFSSWKLYGLLGLSFGLGLWSLRADVARHAQIFHDTSFSLAVSTGVLLSFYGLFFVIITRTVDLQCYPWLGRLGSLTYPLYLIHSYIGFILYQYLGAYVNKYILLISILALMLLLAHLIHVLVEKPLAKPLGRVTNRSLTALSS